MKIGIYGYGMVGSTLANWFDKQDLPLLGINKHNISINDPGKRLYGNLHGSDFDAIFICVSAGTKSINPIFGDRQFYVDDTQIIKCVLATSPGVPIFIKSTVSPDFLSRHKDFPKHTIYANPEFLTERIKESEFDRLPVVHSCPDKELVSRIFPRKPQIITDFKTAFMAKYAHNTFGAMKVSFFNYLRDMLSDSQYEQLVDIATSTGFISKNYTHVPGPDGQQGYGGTCFPKDVRAFIGYLNKNSNGLSKVLSLIDADNNYRRKL